MKKEYYVQCEFKSGKTRTTAWIEERGAKVGSKVTFKDHGDPNQWWEVVSVGTARLPKEQALKRQREYLRLKEKLH